VKAVTESIKKYGHVVNHVQFVNNSIRSRDSILVIDSIERHMATLQILNISKNELGVEGGKHLAKSIPKMKKL
jgi:Ran GTPase-activating protein (RanGAP) involved in mRNA processing and transport